MESTIDCEPTPASEVVCIIEPLNSTREDIPKTSEDSNVSNHEKKLMKHDSNYIDIEVASSPQVEKYEIFQKVQNSNKIIPEKYEHVFKKPYPYKAIGNKEGIRKSTMSASITANMETSENQVIVADIHYEVVVEPPSIDMDTGGQESLDKEPDKNKQSPLKNIDSGNTIEEHVSSQINIYLEEDENTATAIDTGDKEISQKKKTDEQPVKCEKSGKNIKKEILHNKKTEEMSVKGDKSVKKQLQEDAAENDIENSLLVERILPREELKRRKVDLFVDDSLPHWYNVKGNIVTPPINPMNLPKVFEFLPIFGKPKSKAELNDFLKNKVREFVGCGLGDEEFEELSKYCSPDHLKTGNELIMQSNYPTQGILKSNIIKNDNNRIPEFDLECSNLCTVKKHKLRLNRDAKDRYSKKLKYRGVRLIPLQEQESGGHPSTSEPDLEPGKDMLFRVRVYRPYAFTLPRDRIVRGRHSVFSSDIILVGRQSLTELRDRIVCRNEQDMRVDVSSDPTITPLTTAKEVFPSGFLFINNVFYVDHRKGCVDHTVGIRAWAETRGLGVFPARDMASVRLDQLVLKLGHPDVYVHQGNCEHVFMFSEIRLLNAYDPLSLSYYPCHTAISQNQTMYCTTCAEYCAKWIVVGCDRVPFDPAFFCDTCFKLYLYKDGKKIGDFKAYSYRGNEMNMLKGNKIG